MGSSSFLKQLRRISPRASRRLSAEFGPRYLRKRFVTHVQMDISRFAYMGFGASIGWLQAGYLASDALGARLIILNPDKWPFGGALKECALDRFITFPEAEVVKLPTPGALPIESCDFHNLARWGYYDELDWRTCLFGYKPSNYASIEDYRRALFTRCYQPTEFALENITPQLEFLPARYVAWHVRRGDKTDGIWREDDPVSLPVYIRTTMDALERDPNAPRDVVVCTDDEAVIEEAHNMPQVREGFIRVHYDNQEVRWNGYCALHRQGEIKSIKSMITEVLTAQKVVEILRRADYMIGCNSSCLYRLGALLNPNIEHIVSLSENKVFKQYYPL